MRAVVFEEFGTRPEVHEVPDPVPPAGGVVIRVEATGLCRSDWHGWRGHDPDIRLPHVPGHEFAGVIAHVGDGVTGWAPGDRVTVPFVCACGRCASCLAGDQQVCERQTQPGFTGWGSFAELVAIENAEINLIRLPGELSASAAASLGCRFATAFRAVVTQGRVAAGEWVAVHGCGGVGLSAVMIAHAAGARVVAVDTSAGARELARRHGADVVLEAMAGEDAVAAAIRDLTGGGAHVSIDAVGSAATCVSSVRSLRRRGRHVQVGLLPAVAGAPPVPMDLVIAWELELRGSHGMAAHAYPALLELVASGALRPDLLVADTMGLAAAADALTTMDRPAVPGIRLADPRL
ncbi:MULTISPECIES: zinc-dependent alcohol dehydrogenase family protein [Catenuloplanes]|uniref:Alcohol dehydrogenase n=1 Tax=Catenuloplanes niger TaxID=587534 RepID=A0AAE4CSS6_9ACTN|nr:zinc-dependent alcohol dehydrogenase family protein [Catenuloplanes niger]MDR7321613.1 alcohol dehydrogenase [Catenuloplanes niger]